MSTMRCEDARDLLPALARGELREEEAAAVRAHIGACDECADAWAVVESLAAARPAAPARLADRVSAAVAQRPVAAPRRSLMGRLAGAGLAAAAVIALVVAWPDDVTEDGAVVSGRERVVEADPFLDGEIFGATTPTEAELDGMVRVAALSSADDALPLPAAIAADEDVPALALEVGPALGDWPGTDGLSAGVMLVDELTLDEMHLLFEEMTT